MTLHACANCTAEIRRLTAEVARFRAALQEIADVGENEDADTDDLIRCTEVAARALKTHA